MEGQQSRKVPKTARAHKMTKVWSLQVVAALNHNDPDGEEQQVIGALPHQVEAGKDTVQTLCGRTSTYRHREASNGCCVTCLVKAREPRRCLFEPAEATRQMAPKGRGWSKVAPQMTNCNCKPTATHVSALVCSFFSEKRSLKLLCVQSGPHTCARVLSLEQRCSSTRL